MYYENFSFSPRHDFCDSVFAHSAFDYDKIDTGSNKFTSLVLTIPQNIYTFCLMIFARHNIVHKIVSYIENFYSNNTALA